MIAPTSDISSDRFSMKPIHRDQDAGVPERPYGYSTRYKTRLEMGREHSIPLPKMLR